MVAAARRRTGERSKTRNRDGDGERDLRGRRGGRRGRGAARRINTIVSRDKRKGILWGRGRGLLREQNPARRLVPGCVGPRPRRPSGYRGRVPAYIVGPFLSSRCLNTPRTFRGLGVSAGGEERGETAKRERGGDSEARRAEGESEQRAQRTTLPLRRDRPKGREQLGERDGEYACSRRNKLIENQAGRTPVRCVSVGICASVSLASRRSS